MPNHDTRTYVKAMVQALDSKRGEDIQVLKVGDLTSIADVEFRLKTDYNVVPHHVEGHDSASWILIDYGFALVHVFLESAREFYSLEKLWKDATAIPTDEL